MGVFDTIFVVIISIVALSPFIYIVMLESKSTFWSDAWNTLCDSNKRADVAERIWHGSNQYYGKRVIKPHEIVHGRTGNVCMICGSTVYANRDRILRRYAKCGKYEMYIQFPTLCHGCGECGSIFDDNGTLYAHHGSVLIPLKYAEGDV